MKSRIAWGLATLVLLLLAGSYQLAGRESTAEWQWYRGNLHTHSLWSDGNDYPEMIADWYKNQGYHFLALSDHNILSRGEKWIDTAAADRRGAIGGLARYRERFGDAVVTRESNGKTEVRLKTLDEFRGQFEEPGRFLMIQSEEITDRFEKLPVHINAHNLREMIRPQGGASVREVIANNLAAVEAQSIQLGRPMLAHVNHPNYGYGVTAEDLAAVTAERFFEIYNGHPGVNQNGDESHVNMERLWDIANTIRTAVMQAEPLLGLATDDSHNYFGDRGASPGRGWVQVRAAALEADALILALKRGDFYASTGVALKSVEYDRKTKRLSIVIDAQPGVKYETRFIASTPPDSAAIPLPAASFDRNADWIGRVVHQAEGNEAAYTLRGNELYVRALVTADAAPVNPSFPGQRQQAWTQPVGWSASP